MSELMETLLDAMRRVVDRLQSLWEERALPQFAVTIESGADVIVSADVARVVRGRLVLVERHRRPPLRFLKRTAAIFDAGYWKACAMIEGSKE
jgi:hypothetical protein